MVASTCVHCDTPLPEGSRFCPTCGADSSDPGSRPRTGVGPADLLVHLRTAVGDRYEIKELLGRGGMGAVFLAVDKKLDREVAIKVLPPDLAHDAQFVGRFEHEARTAAKLDHAGIIPIYAVEAEGDLHYFVMKYVRGRSLDGLIAAGPVPVDLAQKLLWEAACALGHAHQRGVVHRDVKPANIMLDEQGRALLTDFGISKALQSASSFTATGQVIGTPHFMSPEQARGDDVGGASDQYSLAVVGYRMLAGRLPFEDDSVHTVIYKHVFENPPGVRTYRADVPVFLEAALQRAMLKDPDKRFPTMEAFASAVWPENPVEPTSRGVTARGRRSLTSTEVPTEISQPTARSRPARALAGVAARTRRWPLALASVVLIAGSAGAFLALTPTGRGLLERANLRAAPAPPVARDSGRVADSTAPPAPVVTVPRDSSAAAPQAPPRGQPEPQRTPPRRTQPPPAPAPAPAPEPGFLAINSTPSGTIVIDGREYGDTPNRIELPPGTHVVELRREGYVTWRETVTITSGNDTRKNTTLTPRGT